MGKLRIEYSLDFLDLICGLGFGFGLVVRFVGRGVIFDVFGGLVKVIVIVWVR